MKNTLDYPMMIDSAMRNVVRDALKHISNDGLPEGHHFYVSFNTRYHGVSISPELLEKYPQEITIVLQHQYWDLEIYRHSFCVTLSFNNVPEKLVVPFDALTAFADPSVKFGLQFHHKEEKTIKSDINSDINTVIGNNNNLDINAERQKIRQRDIILPKRPEAENLIASENSDNDSEHDKVISLDAFRKNS